MELTYLGHAGFCLETAGSIVIMDPWLSADGAFDSAWFQFPCNHHMAAFVQTKLLDTTKERFIYISHEHKDHFDLTFLRSLQTADFTFVIPRFHRTELYDQLRNVPCKAIVRCDDGQRLSIPDGELTLYLDDAELDRDSAVLMRSGDETFLNLNDCKIHDRLPDIVQESGPVTIFTAQFSGAVWHPVCYNYPKARYEAISRRKMSSKFEVLSQALKVVQPKLYLTSAGPACFLDPRLLPINFENVNIFPRASKLFQFLTQRFPGVAPFWDEPMPGDRYDVGSAKRTGSASDRVDDSNFVRYVQAYAERFRHLFANRNAALEPSAVAHVLERLEGALSAKLQALHLRDRIRIPLYFRLREAPSQTIRVDFLAGTITYVDEAVEQNFYAIEAEAADIQRVLDGKMTWEDFMLSFRMTLARDPDVYHTVIHGFLVMDVEDMNRFCARVLDAESNCERMLVECGDRRYSVHRFCPHQGADLSRGWIEEGRYLVCPRHRWKYDLKNGGATSVGDASIHAYEVE